MRRQGIAEMAGRLSAAASRYEALTGEERVCSRHRARARLWTGTALAEQGDAESAIALMRSAAENRTPKRTRRGSVK